MNGSVHVRCFNQIWFHNSFNKIVFNYFPNDYVPILKVLSTICTVSSAFNFNRCLIWRLLYMALAYFNALHKCHTICTKCMLIIKFKCFIKLYTNINYLDLIEIKFNIK